MYICAMGCYVGLAREGMSRIVIVNELSDGRDKLFAGIVNWLIVVPVRVFQHKITIQLIDLLQKDIDIVLIRITEGEKSRSFVHTKNGDDVRIKMHITGPKCNCVTFPYQNQYKYTSERKNPSPLT